MDEINPFSRPPVYEYNQVVTYEELGYLVDDLAKIIHRTPWYYPIRKAEYRGGYIALRMLEEWINAGKPRNVNLILKHTGDK